MSETAEQVKLERWEPSPANASLDSAVFQAIGTASVCWTHIDGQEVFDGEKAAWVADGLLRIISDTLAGVRHA